jgi:DNA-binding Lrp family transcriptional regulator
MISALVLLNVERNKVNEIAERLADMAGITEVFSVAGQYDLVAIIRVSDNEALADLVTRNLLKVAGITRSETLIAFKVFSKHDLERMFAIGAEK